MATDGVHPNKQNFIDGLDLIFGRWVALRMAVEMEWGGHDSAEKVEQFKQALVDYFDKGGKNVEAEDIEDILIEVMGSEFHTILEDGSEITVAKQIWTLFQESIRGKTDLLEALRRISLRPLSMDVSRTGDGGEEDDSDASDEQSAAMEEL